MQDTPELDVQYVLRQARAKIIEDCEARVEQIDRALASFAEQHSGTESAYHPISSTKLDAVRQELRRLGESRQVDLVRRTGFNSGTVSVALHQLLRDGCVARDPEKVDGAWNWRWVA